MPSKKPFLSFVIDEDLLRELDEFQAKNKFTSRAQAIIWLLRWALAKKPQVYK